MASIFHQKYTVKNASGKTIRKQSQYWYIDYKTAEGTRKRVRAFKDKAATSQLAAQLEREAEQAQVGIIDRYKEHRKRSLTEHLEDFYNSLLAKGNTEGYAKQTKYRVKQVIEGCKLGTWGDIQASRIEKYLSELRKGKDGISGQTRNYYLQSIRQFCKWMVQDGKASESPIEHLKGIRVLKSDRRRIRRVLEVDEVRRLLEATQEGPVSYGMTGHERYLLYRLAIETGFRANELRSIKVSSFDFKDLTVTVIDAYSKNRRQSIQHLRSDTAEELKEFFKGKLPQTKAFGGTYKKLTDKTSIMIEKDLANAGIPYVLEGCYFDFHSLRHETGTLLRDSGAHPKDAQMIMRHSTMDLTMNIYTHSLRGQESKAIAALPDLSLPSEQAQKATGTDNSAVDGAYKPAYKKLAKNPYFDNTSLSQSCSARELLFYNLRQPSCRLMLLYKAMRQVTTYFCAA